MSEDTAETPQPAQTPGRVLRNRPEWPKGSVVCLGHRSRVLRDNPLGDPADRPVQVYLPAAYSESADPFIALWDLAAFTNSGRGHVNWRAHGENLPERLDRLIGSEEMPPVVVVMPDCYTSLGGNQYVNSTAVGQYADYLVDELLPFVESRVNLISDRKGRGLFGKSSGGFGALHHGMKHSHAWGAIASHAGDIGFDLVYRPAFPATCAALAEYDGDVAAFVRAFWMKNNPSGREYSALMVVAMAASYDPDPGQPERIRLPFDPVTCNLDEARWAQWLQFDPLNLGSADIQALKTLHGLYVDAGNQDQYHTQYGARAFARTLRHHGVEHRYEEFTGGHTGIDWRLDHSLPFLAQVLKKAGRAAT